MCWIRTLVSSKWTEACPLPNKTAVAVTDAFFHLINCRFGMPAIIHSDQGHEFDNHLMQELCLLLGAHNHPASDGMVELFNRTLLMMLVMFAGEHHDDWYDLLPAVMTAYRSSIHESTGFSPYRLMFGEECNWLTTKYVAMPARQCGDKNACMTDGLLRVCSQEVIGLCGITLRLRSVSWTHRDSPVLLVHCQDLKKIPRPRGLVSWLLSEQTDLPPDRLVLGASTVGRSMPGSDASGVITLNTVSA